MDENLEQVIVAALNAANYAEMKAEALEQEAQFLDDQAIRTRAAVQALLGGNDTVSLPTARWSFDEEREEEVAPESVWKEGVVALAGDGDVYVAVRRPNIDPDGEFWLALKHWPLQDFSPSFNDEFVPKPLKVLARIASYDDYDPDEDDYDDASLDAPSDDNYYF